MVNASNISIASVISSLAMLTIFVTSIFTISDRVVESENEIDELSNQLSLMESQIEDKKHENIITRIMNAKTLLDSCEPHPTNSNELNHLLSNAIKLASLEKKFTEAEAQLNESIEYLKECEFFSQSNIDNLSMASTALGEGMIKSSLPLVQAGRPTTQSIQPPSPPLDHSQTSNGLGTVFIEVPTDITITIGNLDGEKIFYTVLGLDNSGERLVPICNPPPGSKFPIGETIVSCSISNSNGEKLSKSFKIIIKLQ